MLLLHLLTLVANRIVFFLTAELGVNDLGELNCPRIKDAFTETKIPRPHAIELSIHHGSVLDFEFLVPILDKVGIPAMQRLGI